MRHSPKSLRDTPLQEGFYAELCAVSLTLEQNSRFLSSGDLL